MICSKCGYVANETDKFCIRCGTPLVIPSPAPVEAPAAEPMEPEIIPAVEAVEEKIEEPVAEAVEAVEEKIEEPVAEAVEAVEEKIEEPVAEAVEAVEEKIKEPVAEAVEAVEEKIKEPVAPVAPVITAAPAPDPAGSVRYEAPRMQTTPAEPAPVKPVVDRLSKPLSVWGYLWRIVLFSIPILNIIPLFVFAFSSGINKNSKHFAGAVLILLLLGLIALVACGILLFLYTDSATISNWIKSIIG